MQLNELESSALNFAIRHHAGQVDKAGLPYIGHVMRVAIACISPPRSLMAALLHDVVEDCGVTLDEIEIGFGEDVRTDVDSLTRRPGESYMDFVYRCGENPCARFVKLADLADNMRPERVALLHPDNENGSNVRLRRYEAAKSYLEGLGRS